MSTKPLPALPVASSLSVEALSHRNHLIKHFLLDIEEPGIEDRRDGWLDVMEEVLDNVSVECSRGDWLANLLRQQECRWRRKQESNDSEPATNDKPLPEPPLDKLRSLAARPAPPRDEQRIGHLVLCVAPHGSPIPLPEEDSGFDLLPANIGCVFLPGSFALQSADGTVLYGLSGGLDGTH